METDLAVSEGNMVQKVGALRLHPTGWAAMPPACRCRESDGKGLRELLQHDSEPVAFLFFFLFNSHIEMGILKMYI